MNTIFKLSGKKQSKDKAKPHQTGKHRVGLALLLAANFLMWLFLCVDMLFGNRWRYELAVWPPQEPLTTLQPQFC